jgi:hypothetical protein
MFHSPLANQTSVRVFEQVERSEYAAPAQTDDEDTNSKPGGSRYE